LIQIFDHHSAPHNSTFIPEKQEEETLVKNHEQPRQPATTTTTLNIVMIHTKRFMTRHQSIDVVNPAEDDEVLSTIEATKQKHLEHERWTWFPENPYLRVVEIEEYVWSSCLVLFSLCIIFSSVSMRYCILQTSPVALFFILFAATTLFAYAYVEALHCANVLLRGGT
jgi:hypothetical protein